MTRTLLLAFLLFGIVVLAAGGWAVRAARWAVTAPARPRALAATT